MDSTLAEQPINIRDVVSGEVDDGIDKVLADYHTADGLPVLSILTKQ